MIVQEVEAADEKKVLAEIELNDTDGEEGEAQILSKASDPNHEKSRDVESC